MLAFFKFRQRSRKVFVKVFFNALLSKSASNIVPIKMAFGTYQPNMLKASPLLIMHGLWGERKLWRGLSQDIAKNTNRKIYVVDARNHGDSPFASNHTAVHLSADVALLIKEQNIDKVSLLGHSMGGRALMYFTLVHPQLVEKLINIDISPLSMPPDFKNAYKLFKFLRRIKIPSRLSEKDGKLAVQKKLQYYIKSQALRGAILRNVKKTSSGQFSWKINLEALYLGLDDYLNGEVFKKPPFLGPVLFICGKRSKVWRPDDWPNIKKIFPNAKLEMIDSGHVVHVQQPQRFLELVSNFLNN